MALFLITGSILAFASIRPFCVLTLSAGSVVRFCWVEEVKVVSVLFLSVVWLDKPDETSSSAENDIVRSCFFIIYVLHNVTLNKNRGAGAELQCVQLLKCSLVQSAASVCLFG